MITTPNDFLVELSQMLKESTTDTSSLRVGYFNRSMRIVKQERKWNWNKIGGTMTLIAATQEYDLTVQFSDFNPMWGIYEVYVGGEKIDYCDYQQRNLVGDDHFYLKPDMKTIGFTSTIAGDEEIVVWYNPRHTNATAYNSTLTPSVPDDMLIPVCTYMKSLVHKGKRQRNDERNELLAYKEQLSTAIMQDASRKVKDGPTIVSPVRAYFKLKRNYRF